MSNHSHELGEYGPLGSTENVDAHADSKPPKKYRQNSEFSEQFTAQRNVSDDNVRMGGWDKFMDWANDFWVWELGAVAFSLACLGVVIWLLVYLDDDDGDDGDTLAQWSYPISPNTFLAVFVTLSKSSMLVAVAAGIATLRYLHFETGRFPVTHFDDFDEASRGPWGSVLFIFGDGWPKSKPRKVACAGAVIMVLALAMDPFAQQILRYKFAEILDSNPQAALMSAADSPDSSDLSLLQSDYLRRTFNGGLLGFGQKPSFICTTGNCTWPSFASFGLESECENVKHTSNVTCAPGAGILNETCTELVYNVPSVNLEISLKNGTTNNSSTSQQIYTFAKGVISGDYPRNESDASVLFEFVIAQLNTEVGTGEVIYPTIESGPAPWNITACKIKWVAKVYENLTVVNGILDDKPPKVVYLRKIAGNTTDDPASDTFLKFQAADKNAIPKDFRNKTYWTSLNSGSADVRRLLQFDYNIPRIANSDNLDMKDVFSIGALMFWKADVATTMHQTTTSFTNLIRLMNPDYQISGKASYGRIFIDVDWVFFSLPAALTLSSAAFLIVVIVMWNQRPYGVKTSPWKTSGLGYLYYPIKDAMGRGMSTAIESRTKMAVMAERHKVKYRGIDKGERELAMS